MWKFFALGDESGATEQTTATGDLTKAENNWKPNLCNYLKPR